MKNNLDNLCAGSANVLPLELLEKKLARAQPLRIKLGLDPTAPDLHLGHAVVLQKMKDFQQAGHTVIFLIGDFTSLIGDPSGRSKTRPPLTPDQIEQNAKTYFQQVERIIDRTKTEVRYNSEWLSPISLSEWIKLAGKTTLARIIEREDFAKRLHENNPIGFHELFYPLLQGYDSVALKADVELGGTDQTFNLLMGRYLQEHYHQEPQVIMTMPLLEGLDGIHKMSKSLGNHIGLTEKPADVFGKLMSLTDPMMWRYYEILLRTQAETIESWKVAVEQEKAHPMQLKKEMAHAILTRFWSAEEASAAQHHFENIFQQQDYSQAHEVQLLANNPSKLWIVELLKQLKVIDTTSQGKRLIEAGAISIDGHKVMNFQQEVALTSGMILKAGKHKIFKIS